MQNEEEKAIKGQYSGRSDALRDSMRTLIAKLEKQKRRTVVPAQEA